MAAAREVCARLASFPLKHVVVLSSAAVYSPNHQSTGLLAETAFVPEGRSEIADGWREVERLAGQIGAHSGAGPTAITVLRPAAALDGEDYFSRLLTGRLAITYPGHDPTIQLLSLRDLAAAVVAAVERRAEGVYNVAPAAGIPLKAALRVAGVPRLPLGRVVQNAVRAVASSPSLSAPPDQLKYIQLSWTVSGDKIRRDLGFVYVFFSGRALVDGVSGAVSLMAYDGVPAGPTGVYPIRQLQEAIHRLPIRWAVLFFDVSLDPAPGADLATIPQPDWESGRSDARKDVEMWMVGNRKLQEAQAHDHSKHGLFTYYLLRGLQGVADLNRDSIVTAGALCTYAKSQVIQVTRDQVRSKQEPVCLPQVGRGGMARIYPIAKGNNPKPAPIPNAPESSASVSTPPPAFMQVGP